jgi:hypothetical protein
LYRQNRRYPPLFAGFMAIIGCIPFWTLLNWVNADTSFIPLSVVSISAGLASGVTGPIVKATLQNVTMPQTRGQAFALFTIFDDLGRGLGPVFVSMLIIQLGGRTAAFNVGVLGWVLCGCFNVMMYFTVEKDERQVQMSIATKISREHEMVCLDQPVLQ